MYIMLLLMSCRGTGLDSDWLHTWTSQGVDGAGPSTAMGSVGLGRVQMMMRHLASVGEAYAHTALEDGAWSLWPMNAPQVAATGPPIPPADGGRNQGGARNLHMRTPARTVNDNLANILAMAETVREVLPHMPDDLIFQVQFVFTTQLCFSYEYIVNCHFITIISKLVFKLSFYIP